jgi:hypothetical protein
MTTKQQLPRDLQAAVIEPNSWREQNEFYNSQLPEEKRLTPDLLEEKMINEALSSPDTVQDFVWVFVPYKIGATQQWKERGMHCLLNRNQALLLYDIDNEEQYRASKKLTPATEEQKANYIDRIMNSEP